MNEQSNVSAPSLKVHVWNETIPIRAKTEISILMRASPSEMYTFTYLCKYTQHPDFDEHYEASEFPKEISGDFKNSVDEILTQAIQQLANSDIQQYSWKKSIAITINTKKYVLIFEAERKQ